MTINDKGIISLCNSLAECKISLWGGNIISYRPKNEQHDIFWLGELNKFDHVQAIRGGIPVCWPRFAEEKLNNHFPRHGFARLSLWDLSHVYVDENLMEVRLSLTPDSRYNLKVNAELHIKITDKLECSLETVNNGTEKFNFSEALHAYFNIGSKDDIKITGLSGHNYNNSLDGNTYHLNTDLTIKNEFDAAFVNHTNKIEIEDKIFNRIISIEKSGSTNTIIWNPNKDLAEMSPNQHKHFICVEPANRGDSFVTLAPKEKHTLRMIVSLKKI